MPDIFTPATLWTAWNMSPSLLISLAAAVVIYAWGMSRAGIPRRSSAPPPRPAVRDLRSATTMTRRAVLSFTGANVVLLVALVSPLDALSESLFTAHMVQHLLLLLVAAPLLVMSEFPVALLWALPRAWAQSLVRGLNRSRLLRRTWQVLNIPAVAWLIFTLETWAWHSSALYQAALGNEAVHTLEHASFLLSGMLFWWVLLKRSTARHVQYGMAVLYLFASGVQSGLLGALMIFTLEPWYAYYAGRVAAWGLTPMQDQQLAGLVMWIPGGAVFNVLTLAYFGAWWRALERRNGGRKSPA